MKKLELKNLKVKALPKDQQFSLKGGCTGTVCDGNGGPKPALTKGLGCTIPNAPGGSICADDPTKPAKPSIAAI